MMEWYEELGYFDELDAPGFRSAYESDPDLFTEQDETIIDPDLDDDIDI